MPHNLDLIWTFAGGLGAALIFGFLTHRIGLSPIVGYLLAGVVVGPFTPGFVAHGGIAEQFAELGVILLMFGVGLHFDLRDLFAVGRIAIPGALVQIAVATALGVLVMSAFGWTWAAGLVFGLAISVASTVVLLRVLSDADVLHTKTGHVAVGWLLVEDVFTVLVLVFLPILFEPGGGGTTATIAVSIGLAIMKIIALVAFTLVGGRRVIPAILGYVAKTRSRELFMLTVLTIALGIAVGSAKLFGASMALGAFLAGLVVGQSDFSARAASEALPLRDAFSVLFFVSMGMLLDPASLLPNVGVIAATLAIILVGKPLAALLVVRMMGYPKGVGITVGAALAQVGEFSFILAALGRKLGILPDGATHVLVAASVLSITLNPLLFRAAGRVARRMRMTSTPPVPAASSPLSGHTIIVGYGPVGRTVVGLMREHDVPVVVIDLDHETIAAIKAGGGHAVYGDAEQAEVLDSAYVREASSLVFTASGNAENVIRAARSINPKLLVLTRATYLHEREALETAGASTVVTAEREIALAMTERVLRQLGATPDQIDRARDGVRDVLRRLQRHA